MPDNSKESLELVKCITVKMLCGCLNMRCTRIIILAGKRISEFRLIESCYFPFQFEWNTHRELSFSHECMQILW